MWEREVSYLVRLGISQSLWEERKAIERASRLEREQHRIDTERGVTRWVDGGVLFTKQPDGAVSAIWAHPDAWRLVNL